MGTTVGDVALVPHSSAGDSPSDVPRVGQVADRSTAASDDRRDPWMPVDRHVEWLGSSQGALIAGTADGFVTAFRLNDLGSDTPSAPTTERSAAKD